MLTIILIAVGVLLLIAGAVNRKNLLIWFKSEVNDVTSKMVNNIKVAKLHIKEYKKQMNDILDQSYEFNVAATQAEQRMNQIRLEISKLERDAASAKKRGEDAIAKSKLATLLNYKKELEGVEKHYETASKSEELLKAKIIRLEGTIATLEFKIKNLEARKATAKLMIKANGTTDVDFKDLLEEEELKVSAQELKAECINRVEKDTFDSEIEDAYNNL